MVDSPKITVIIPVFNAYNYIADTINSVLVQTYSNLEVIVVDNGSTDDGIKIVNAFAAKDSRIKIIRLDFNSGGPARPRNIGIQNATGDYIAFLDADDIWSENKLEMQLAFLFENNYNFISTDYSFINESGIKMGFSIVTKIKKILFSKNHSLKGAIFFSNIYTSSVLVENSNDLVFDEDDLLAAAEDWYLWLTLLRKNYRHGFLKQELISYRIVANSAVGRDNMKKIRMRQAYCLSKFIMSCRAYEYWPIFRLRQLLSF